MYVGQPEWSLHVGRKNNKVNYCSDEKERKIRGKGPP